MNSSGTMMTLELVDGRPDGLIIADIGVWNGQILSFPKTLLPALQKSRPELHKTGVYILLGYSPDHPRLPSMYVGEADDIAKRLQNHPKISLFDQVILIVSKDDNLTKTHALFWEAKLIEMLSKQEGIRLENGNMGQPASLPRREMSLQDYHLQHIRMLLPTLFGLYFLSEAPKPVSCEPVSPVKVSPVPMTPSPVFTLSFLKGAVQAEAHEPEPGQFVVLAGAVCRYRGTRSFLEGKQFESLVKEITQCLETGVLVPEHLDSELALLTQDKTFESANEAAMFVCGKSDHGAIRWKVQGTEITYGEWLKSQRVQRPSLTSL